MLETRRAQFVTQRVKESLQAQGGDLSSKVIQFFLGDS